MPSTCGTSHSSNTSASCCRSPSPRSGGSTPSFVACWHTSDSSVEKCSSSSNSEHRIEWEPASTNATPTSRALPAYPFEPAVLPTRTAAITADASSWPASSWHSSAKGCRLPGEPRRAHAHSRPSRRYSSTRRFCCSSASRITSFAWFLLIVRYAWRSSPSCTCFTAPEFLKYSTATVCASRPCSEKKSLRSKKRSRSVGCAPSDLRYLAIGVTSDLSIESDESSLSEPRSETADIFSQDGAASDGGSRYLRRTERRVTVARAQIDGRRADKCEFTALPWLDFAPDESPR